MENLTMSAMWQSTEPVTMLTNRNVTKKTEDGTDTEIYQYLSTETTQLLEIIFFCSFYPLIIVIGIIGNILTLRAIRYMREMSSTSYMLLGLTFADLFHMIGKIPYIMYQWALYFYPDALQSIGLSSYHIARISHLPARIGKVITVCIVFERIFAVWKPLHVREIWSKKRTMILVVSIYCITTVIDLPTLGDISDMKKGNSQDTYDQIARTMSSEDWTWKMYRLGVRVLFDVLPVCTVMVCNIIIIAGIQYNSKTIKAMSNSSTRRIQDKRVTRMLLAFSITFVILCIPLDTIVFIMEVDFTGSVYDLRNNLLRFGALIAVLMELTNSAINFIIYGVTNKPYREFYRYTLSCGCPKPHHSKALSWMSSAESTRDIEK